jgi:hypothetical protein
MFSDPIGLVKLGHIRCHIYQETQITVLQRRRRRISLVPCCSNVHFEMVARSHSPGLHGIVQAIGLRSIRGFADIFSSVPPTS